MALQSGDVNNCARQRRKFVSPFTLVSFDPGVSLRNPQARKTQHPWFVNQTIFDMLLDGAMLLRLSKTSKQRNKRQTNEQTKGY